MKCMKKSTDSVFSHLSADATDSIQMWMVDCCEVHTAPLSSKNTINASRMYESYKNWCLFNDEDVMSECSFHKCMAEYGHMSKTIDSGVVYIGIDLINLFF